MATYPIKMLKDEDNKPFVPLVSTDCIRDENNQTLQQVLNKKLSPTNLLSGEFVRVTTEGDNCYINVDLPANLNIINNLTTSSAGQGALDAYQGKVLKDSIPQVVNDLSSTSTTSALSANQGYILNNKFNNYTTTTDMNNKFSNYTTTADMNSRFNNYLSLTGGTINGNLTARHILANTTSGEATVGAGYNNSTIYFYANSTNRGIYDSSYGAIIKATNTEKIFYGTANGINTNSTFAFSSSSNYSISGYNKIVVKNGICFITAFIKCVSPVAEDISIATVPKPYVGEVRNPHWQFHNWEASPNGMPLVVQIKDDGDFRIRRGVADLNYFIQICYPIQ